MQSHVFDFFMPYQGYSFLIKTSGVYPPLGQTYLYASVMSLLSALLLSTLSSMTGMKFLNRLVK